MLSEINEYIGKLNKNKRIEKVNKTKNITIQRKNKFNERPK